MITTEQLVRQNVIACFSGLVGTLAGNAGNFSRISDISISELANEAFELCIPVADYEEAAIQAGWVYDGVGYWTRDTQNDGQKYAATPEEACEHDGLEPYDREIFEHWAVSEWFADHLRAHGERVGPFDSFTVWGRTCSGQGIACDWVVQQIAKAINA